VAGHRSISSGVNPGHTFEKFIEPFMHRKTFLQSMAIFSLTGFSLPLREFHATAMEDESTERMPMLFLGHGSPMNAIEDTVFSRGWQTIGARLPRPRAILCISAHWETRGTWVTAMEKPRTIHDFGGFPQALFDVQYPAPGSPSIAADTKAAITTTQVGLDHQWGLDHGCWSVVKHLYPKADIPVLQLSLDYTRPASWHLALGRELSALRRKGILILGSGNMVHNLGRVNWSQPASGYDWAVEANTLFKEHIQAGRFDQLANYRALGSAVNLSIPTPEHYLPLLYILGLKEKDETIRFFNDELVMGSISMTSLQVG